MNLSLENCQIIRIAGNRQSGFQDGNAANSMFNSPWSICISNDHRLYVADRNNHRIRMIYNNQVTTIAGNGKEGFQDGNAQDSMFAHPSGICISNDNRLYVADYTNHRIRMIHNNEVTTIAGNGQKGCEDGNALDAKFNNPIGCTIKDGTLYISDYTNLKIRMIRDNQVTSIKSSMRFLPGAICASKAGKVYFTSNYEHKIFTIRDDEVVVIAGNGQVGFRDGNALDAMFSYPSGLCTTMGERLLIVDNFNWKIRMLNHGQVTSLAGDGQRSFQENALFSTRTAICISQNDGRMYAADINGTIKMIYNTDLPLDMFGFGILLDMQKTLGDCKILVHDVTYQLHSKFIKARCPALFDQSCLSLIEESGISNEAFDSFLTFLYSNRLKRDSCPPLPPMSMKSILEIVFILDVCSNSKRMLRDIMPIFQRRLFEMLKNEEEQKSLLIELLPFSYHLKELLNKNQNSSSVKLYTQYCYDILVHELQKKRSLVGQYVSYLNEQFRNLNILEETSSEAPQTPEMSNQSVLEAELIELSRLAFEKTDFSLIGKMESKIQSLEPYQSSTAYKIPADLETWTEPDFTIKILNDDREYRVHKLILCGRWKYFSSMIESGLKEAQEDRMTLSEDWNKSRLEKFIRYLYLNEIEFDDLNDAVWLIENGKLYGISVQTWIDEENQDVAAFGFEALYENCLNLLRSQ